MKVKINGETKQIDVMNLKELIEDYGLNPNRIVVEYNGAIPSKEEYEKIIIKENDIIELIHFVGGG
jgi:sulfur carrier protein